LCRAFYLITKTFVLLSVTKLLAFFSIHHKNILEVYIETIEYTNQTIYEHP